MVGPIDTMNEISITIIKGRFTWSQVLSPKYDMDAYMTTFFWRWSLGSVLRSELSKKLDPTLNTSPINIVASNNQDPTLMVSKPSFDCFLFRVKCWDFASVLGFATACEPALNCLYKPNCLLLNHNMDAHRWIQTKMLPWNIFEHPTSPSSIEILVFSCFQYDAPQTSPSKG